MQERWSYKVEGDGFHPSQWFAEEILDSSQPCPNCQQTGWDWVVGCVCCELSPEDVD